MRNSDPVMKHHIMDDVFKMIVELGLNLKVAGEKSDVGFDNYFKEAQLPNAEEKFQTNHEEKHKKRWKLKKHSSFKLKRKCEKERSQKTSNVSSTFKPRCTSLSEQPSSEEESQKADVRLSPQTNGDVGEDKDTSEGTAEETDSSPESQDMSMLQHLALTALNLTAPASSLLLNNRRSSWVQLSGHPGCLAPAGPGTIWKKRSGETSESLAYQGLMKDIAKEIIPTFYREVVFQGDHFIEMRDLLYNFNNPSVMDIKIGTRTFLESEVANKKARNDLYCKMIKVDPNAPCEEERSQEAVTKLRYMDFRDNMSSSRSLGFRIEALKMSGSKEVTEVRTVRTQEGVVETLGKFFQHKESVKKKFLARLKEIKQIFESSEFFKKHEVIGSSILLIYDDEKAGAWMIDFAKTLPVPDNIIIDHVSPWVLGNHEEGYIFGLSNLIQAVKEVSSHKSKRKFFFNR